mmetsp:Transcript_41785/g.118134  ORF Transcript_41785/g.118134 Transcript_41785/m.118134 type:complete len:100 (-) Transcript_41785:100-399(-)
MLELAGGCGASSQPASSLAEKPKSDRGAAALAATLQAVPKAVEPTAGGATSAGAGHATAALLQEEENFSNALGRALRLNWGEVPGATSAAVLNWSSLML